MEKEGDLTCLLKWKSEGRREKKSDGRPGIYMGARVVCAFQIEGGGPVNRDEQSTPIPPGVSFPQSSHYARIQSGASDMGLHNEQNCCFPCVTVAWAVIESAALSCTYSTVKWKKTSFIRP